VLALAARRLGKLVVAGQAGGPLGEEQERRG
jgi:hypothetical protein